MQFKDILNWVKEKYIKWNLEAPIREQKREERRSKAIETEKKNIEMLKLKTEKERILANLEEAKTKKIKAQQKRPGLNLFSTNQQTKGMSKPKLDIGINLPKQNKTKNKGLFEDL